MGATLLRRRSAAGLALIVMATTLALIPSAPASAHSCAYPWIRLGSFALDDTASSGSIPTPIPPSFYVAGEGQQAFFTVWANEWCDPGTGQVNDGKVDWSTVNGTAVAGSDFPSGQSGTIEVFNPSPPATHVASSDSRGILTTDDTALEPALEQFTVKLTENVGDVKTPSQAPVYLVDSDGLTRFTTVAGTAASVSEGGKFKFPIFRAGDLTGNPAATVSATCAPTDCTVTLPTWGSTQRFGIATVNITQDSLVEGDESVTVSLSGSTEPPSSATFSIIDDDGGSSDTTPPVTWFHHPKHNKDYKHGALLARTIHVFIPVDDKDNPFGPAEPSGIDTTQFALRRKKTGGACQWWTAGRDWKGGKCGSPNWITFKTCGPYSSDRDLCEYDLKKDLASSKGTKIRNYRVLSRAEDGAGNWETSFEVGRNKNTFEINKK